MVATRAWSGLGLPVEALQLVFLKDDVEDASHAIRIVFRRRVGDDLHPVNGACWNLLEERVLGGTGQSGRPSIDEDLDLRRAPKRYVAVDVHGNRRDVDQQFAGRSPCGGEVISNFEHAAVDEHFEGTRFFNDHRFFQGVDAGAEGNSAGIVGSCCPRREHDGLRAEWGITHKIHLESVPSKRQFSQAECPVISSELTSDNAAVPHAHQGDGCEGDSVAVLCFCYGSNHRANGGFFTAITARSTAGALAPCRRGEQERTEDEPARTQWHHCSRKASRFLHVFCIRRLDARFV